MISINYKTKANNLTALPRNEVDDNNDWKNIEMQNFHPQDHLKSSVFVGQPTQTIHDYACSMQPVENRKAVNAMMYKHTQICTYYTQYIVWMHLHP